VIKTISHGGKIKIQRICFIFQPGVISCVPALDLTALFFCLSIKPIVAYETMNLNQLKTLSYVSMKRAKSSMKNGRGFSYVVSFCYLNGKYYLNSNIRVTLICSTFQTG